MIKKKRDNRENMQYTAERAYQYTLQDSLGPLLPKEASAYTRHV